MATTIGTARAALYAILTAHTWPTTATWTEAPVLSWGPPVAVLGQQILAMRGVEASDEDPAVIGGVRPRDEVYTIVLTLEVHGPEHDAATVEARYWALADEVRTLVYANRLLSGTLPQGSLGARVSSKTADDGAMPANGGGQVMFGFIRVLVQARVA